MANITHHFLSQKMNCLIFCYKTISLMIFVLYFHFNDIIKIWYINGKLLNIEI